MLCCVSRKAVEGPGFKRPPLIPPRGVSLTNSSVPLSVTSSLKFTESQFFSVNNCPPTVKDKLEPLRVEDDPPVLLPCAICGRTFKPQSLEKHIKICEKTVVKKRKPFDSSKQRIKGTELEEFLPKEPKRRIHEDRNNTSDSWKKTHDEFIRTIRAAKGDTIQTTNIRKTASNVATGAPTRANEKGLCPTCSRQFGIKAYDRHVAWCKERLTRVPSNPSTNVAKERLDARMKYRAPVLKNRRMTNREKYSPNTTVNISIKNSPSTPGSLKPKESVSLPSCKISESPKGVKPGATTRKIAQGRNDGIIPSGPLKSRLSDRSFKNSMEDSRPAWNNYVRRRPDFNLLLKGRTGLSQNYDPFLLAERQMNDLMSDTCSDNSFLESPGSQKNNNPLSHSSAFVKYPNQITLDSRGSDKRVSLIAPPTDFDDLSTGFSSDSTETNSISREIFGDLVLAPNHRGDQIKNNNNNNNNNNNLPILGRRIIIDKSKALGRITDNDDTVYSGSNKNTQIERNNKIINEKTSPKVIRPHVNRSNSVRAASANKLPERNNSVLSMGNKASSRSTPASGFNNRNNNYVNLSGSNLSLSSIVSSEVGVKRSNSLFEDLVNSFEDDVSGSYPSLRSLLKNDSLSSPSPVQANRGRNGQISDEDLSSPEGYSKKEHTKLSADSAYSSLNRKYSNNNGRNTNDVNAKLEDETSVKRRDFRDREISSAMRSKMSKFCHECGTRFPETAKFCCECGIQRLFL